MPVNHNFNGTPLQYLSTSPTRDQATIDRLSANVANPFAGLLPGTGLNGSVVSRSQLLAASPQYSGAAGVQGQAFTDGSSYFHAFDARIEKRFSHGFLMLVNFQWSKLMEKRSRLNDNGPAAGKANRRRGPSIPPRLERHLRSALWQRQGCIEERQSGCRLPSWGAGT